MRGSVKRRCDVCGTRQFSEVSAKKHGCVNGHTERYSWSFVADVARPGEKRKQISRSGFPTKADAEKELAGLVTDHDRGSQVEPSRLTFADQADAWLARLRVEGRAASTISSYRRQLRLHILDRIGSVRLQALTAGDLDRLYADLLESGRKQEKTGEPGLSPRTTRYVHTIISAILKDALKKGLVAKNVATVSSPPSEKSAKAPESDFWTVDQLRVFLDAAKEHDFAAMWRTAAMTGMRRGELAGLRWVDVDLEGDDLAPGRIHVRQQYASDGEGHFDFAPPKSERGRRIIDLDATTVKVLREHQKAQLELRMSLGAGRPELVFERETPNGFIPLRPDSGVSAAFDRIVRRLDIPRIPVHGLRHTHTSHIVAGGMDLLAISARMGHASVAFTLDRYGHLLPGQQAHVAAQVAALIDRSA